MHLGRSGTGLRCERTHWEFEAMTGKALLFPVALGWLPPLRAAAQTATDMAVSGVPGGPWFFRSPEEGTPEYEPSVAQSWSRLADDLTAARRIRSVLD